MVHLKVTSPTLTSLRKKDITMTVNDRDTTSMTKDRQEETFLNAGE